MPEGFGVVAFQGRREGRSAFALVNARWSRALEDGGYTVVDYVAGPPSPDFVIHHDFAGANAVMSCGSLSAVEVVEAAHGMAFRVGGGFGAGLK